MLKRLAKFTKSNSFFLFGARGTGKTHLLKEIYSNADNWYIDLLNPGPS
jgi:chromosomal replication initiation ATPase DnaA